MLLKNKKTGEIVDINIKAIKYSNNPLEYPKRRLYTSLAELNEEWEDIPEEPKEYWCIYADKPQRADCGDILEEDFKAIGNYFSSKEEAEKAVEKLKAWKRLKDSGFRVNNWVYALEGNRENGSIPIEIKAECKVKTPYKDLELLFGGEE